MIDLFSSWRAVFVAVLLVIAAVLIQSALDDAITARQQLEKKQTVDKVIDTTKEGIRIWTEN